MPPTIRAAKPEDSAPILELMVAVIRATTDHAHQSDTIENGQTTRANAFILSRKTKHRLSA
jgi:hypothetical protein